MVSWGEFAAAAPELAERGAKRFAIGFAYIATVARDGRPQLHPVTPLIAGGRLYIFAALSTPKARNLRRDGRYALHAVLGKDDEEFLITGRAVVADTPETRALAYEAARAIGMTTKDDVLIELLIERAHWAVWEGLGTPDIRKVSKRWPER